MKTSEQNLPTTAVAHRALEGELPARYRCSQLDAFWELVGSLLRPGMRILDVGSGRHPSIAPHRRPAGCAYVGLDLTAHELDAAPPGSYSDAVVADITQFVPELEQSFDLAVSWQVLEHVKPLDAAFENVRRYLRPGAHFVTQFSGTFSAFGILNQLLPRRLSETAVHRLTHRDRASIFPAYYHHCWYTAIERVLQSWQSYQITPRYLGADYFAFSRPLQAVYLMYEESAARRGWRNLAGYYLVHAVR